MSQTFHSQILLPPSPQGRAGLDTVNAEGVLGVGVPINSLIVTPLSLSPACKKRLISVKGKCRSIDSTLELCDISPLRKVSTVTSDPGRLHEMVERRDLTHPLELYPPAHCQREGPGTVSAPTLNLAREAVSLVEWRGVDPPPLMTRHAPPSPRVTSPRSGSVSQARDLLHTVHARERTSHCMYSTPVTQNPLRRALNMWKACNPSEWVLRTITKGYRLQFTTTPPVSSVILPSRVHAQGAAVLREEVLSLLHKGAIERVPRQIHNVGYFSRYFLVNKKGGGVRPILDLRGLNKHLRKLKFKMLTCDALLRTVRRGDYFTSIDIKDAFQHVAVYPAHRKYLRFEFEGQWYQYTVLPFGMRLSPRTFVKIIQTALGPLRQQGIRIATYIDDWLLYGDTPQQVVLHTNIVLAHLAALGFTVNREKSVLTPSQQITFIGVLLDSATLTARLSTERVADFQTLLSLFRAGHTVTYRHCMRLNGMMASSISLIRLGRFHMRPFQKWMLSLGIHPSRGMSQVVVTDAAISALRPWRPVQFLTQGVPMELVSSRLVITTDASLRGWGATFQGRSASGLWEGDLLRAHINFLELMAVQLALSHFLPLVRHQHVLVRTDNLTTMFYINKQGGMHSDRLDGLARSLTLWCVDNLASLTAEYVPGLLNRGADLLSRGQARYDDSPPRGGGADLVSLWLPSGGPVRVGGQHEVSSLLRIEGEVDPW